MKVIRIVAALIMTTAIPAQAASTWAIVVHGGAGVIERKDLSPEQEAAYRAGMNRAIQAGAAVLTKGGSALDAIEGAGWEVRFVVPRPRGGYSVVGRGAKGLHIPQPIESPQGYDYYYGGTAVSATTVESAPTQVTCPGTHHACRVLPPGTYEKAIADRIGG